MYRYVLCLLFSITAISVRAQLNLQQIGHLSYAPLSLSGCWHYVDSHGGEWALVGTSAGLSIVDLKNPAQPVERFAVPSLQNNWREVKVWNNFAYFGSEAPGSGINIVDLRHLPDTIYTKVWFGKGFVADSINRSHTVQAVDGYLYVFGGGNITNGATIASLEDPWNPVIKGVYKDQYVHDGFIRGDTLWTSEIYKGWFGVVDIADKANPKLLTTQPTPGAFNHNSELSPDGKTLFTTDEKPNAPLASFDVSDLDNIKLLDVYFPSQFPSKEVHNVRVFGDFLVNPSYGGQLTIVDASRPDNLIETAWAVMGTSIVWDAVPYLPSGIIFASAKNEGLFIYQPTYQRAAWLEGHVYNVANGQPLFGAKVLLQNTVNGDTTDLQGIYKTGAAQAGQYTVEVSRPGYYTQLLPVSLQNGQLTIQDFYLIPDPTQPECDPFSLEIPQNGVDEDCDELDQFYLDLPPYLYAIAGKSFDVIFEHHFLSRHPQDYVLVAETPLDGVNFTYKWQWTGIDSSGEYPFKLEIRNQAGAVLDSARCVVRIAPDLAGTSPDTFNVVLMGHSFFDQGWLPSLIQYHTDIIQSKEVRYFGQKESWLSPNTRYEAYGGTTAQWFWSDPASPLFLGGNVPNVQALYDSIICTGCNPDWLVLHLDINEICLNAEIKDLSPEVMDDSIQQYWTKYLFPMVEYLKTQTPNLKLGLCLSPPAALPATFEKTFPNNSVLNNRWRWQKIVNRLCHNYKEKYAGSDSLGIYLIPEQISFDVTYGYLENDAVHPSTSGYFTIADNIYAWMRWLMQPVKTDPVDTTTTSGVHYFTGKNTLEKAFQLFPNPTTVENIYVKTPPGINLLHLSGYALGGQPLGEATPAPGRTMHLFSLPAAFQGAYWLRLTTDAGVFVLKGAKL